MPRAQSCSSLALALATLAILLIPGADGNEWVLAPVNNPGSTSTNCNAACASTGTTCNSSVMDTLAAAEPATAKTAAAKAVGPPPSLVPFATPSPPPPPSRLPSPPPSLPPSPPPSRTPAAGTSGSTAASPTDAPSAATTAPAAFDDLGESQASTRDVPAFSQTMVAAIVGSVHGLCICVGMTYFFVYRRRRDQASRKTLSKAMGEYRGGPCYHRARASAATGSSSQPHKPHKPAGRDHRRACRGLNSYRSSSGLYPCRSSMALTLLRGRIMPAECNLHAPAPTLYADSESATVGLQGTQLLKSASQAVGYFRFDPLSFK
ncbi:hypothetical protein T492DRAFT_1118451 [Pavlovales sp. CCMP2436]|nr:hypothetical protein T492DRAFT_1118451 [Pavlovales sp. CCMP2436]